MAGGGVDFHPPSKVTQALLDAEQAETACRMGIVGS
jgi:hypothetical protein